MSKNVCPHCGEKISTWKKWQLTDNKYGRVCPSCEEIIVLPKWYVKFTYAFNLIGAIILFIVTRGVTDNRVMILLLGAAGLVLLNGLMIQLIEIYKPEDDK